MAPRKRKGSVYHIEVCQPHRRNEAIKVFALLPVGKRKAERKATEIAQRQDTCIHGMPYLPHCVVCLCVMLTLRLIGLCSAGFFWHR